MIKLELYTLNYSSNSKEIGIYPQTDGMSPGYDFDAPDSVHKIPYNEFPVYAPNLNYFVLDKKTKLTDFISTTIIETSGFIMNDKVKNILSDYKLMSHKFFNATIKAKNNFLYNYYWMQLVSDFEEFIDFENMIFYKMNYFGDLVEDTPIKIKNFNELLIERDKAMKIYIGHTIDSLNIVLKNSFNIELDLFSIPLLSSEIFISKNLVGRLNYEKISGIEINPAKPNYIHLK